MRKGADVASQQWAYAILSLTDRQAHDVDPETGATAGWSYQCDLTTTTPTGATEKQPVARIEQILDHDPFERMLGILGGAGWELVSIQHGIAPFGHVLSRSYGGNLVWNSRVAYLKRPYLPGQGLGFGTVAF